MQLYDLLAEQESAITDRWFNLIIDSYPADASGFLKNQKNRFLNPVGNTIAREIVVLYHSLLTSTNSEALAASIENIVKIRSVQEFTPAEAIGFVFLVKKAVRDALNDSRHIDVEELDNFDRKVDELALRCFDCYTRCREKIYEIRLNELRRRSRLPYFSNKQTDSASK